MADKTKIEWADATWNPLRGVKGPWSCVKISVGCSFCFAERLNVWRGGPEYRVGTDELRLDEEILTQPLRWKRPRRIFVCSMTDLFEERVKDKWIDQVFAVMALARQHQFQILTKRAERMSTYLDAASRRVYPVISKIGNALEIRYTQGAYYLADWPLVNVWCGVSIENQARADERIPWLLKTPAAVRFLSLEPLLGPIDLMNAGALEAGLSRAQMGVDVDKGRAEPAQVSGITETGVSLTSARSGAPETGQPLAGISWVICGGESGGPPERALVEYARWANPMGRKHPGWQPKPEALEWVRAIISQCEAARVPVLFKQWGGPRPTSGGRVLDEKIWHQFPDESGGVYDVAEARKQNLA